MVHARIAISKKVLIIGLAFACAVAFMPMFGTADAYAATAKKLSVKASAASIYTGKTATYKASTKPSKNAKRTKWSSSNKSIAKVSKSNAAKITVKGISPGEVTIKAKNGKKVVKKTLKVYQKLTGVKFEDLTVGSDTLTVGDTLKATVSQSRASVNYQWYRTDPETGDITIIKSATDQTYALTVRDAGYYIGVRVQGTGYYVGTVDFSLNTEVKGNIKLKGIEIDDTTPTVGQTLVATIDPDEATNHSTYQWFRSSASGLITPITGATDNVYQITGAEVGFKIYCVADGQWLFTGKAKSEMTDAVAENTYWDAYIMDKDDDLIDYAHAGDTLYAYIDTPAEPGDFTFQWYKNDTLIANATGASYTVPDTAAAGAGYTVLITPKAGAGYGTDAHMSEKVYICTDIYGGSISLNNTTPTSATREIIATVKDAKGSIYTTTTDPSETAGDVVVVWCLDESSSIANLIYNKSGSNYYPVTGSTFYPWDATYYDKDGKAITFTGHKIAAAAVGAYEFYDRTDTSDPFKGSYYCGTIRGNTTSKITEEISGCAIDSDTANLGSEGAKEYAIGSTLTAKPAPAKATVTYQWYVDNAEVSGATNAAYMITAGDAGKAIYCEIKGTGDYSGTVCSDKTNLTANPSKSAASVVAAAEEDSTSAAAASAAGETLYATAVPTAANNYVAYQWYKDGTAISGATSATYTPKEAGTYKVAATLTTDGQAIWSNGTAAFDSTNTVRVTEKIDSLALTIQDTATPTPATTTNTYVGYTITATPTPAASSSGATYAWYRDNTGTTAIAGATAASYMITASDIGHKLVCKITGSGDYANAAAAAKTSTNAVYDLSGVTEDTYIPQVGLATDNKTEPAHVTVYDSQPTPTKITEDLSSYVTYTWAVNGTTVATNKPYTPVAADYGKALSLTITGDGTHVTGTATYTYEAGIKEGEFEVSLANVQSSYAVGDTITIETDPSDAAATATFQWYRSDADTVDNAYAALGSSYTGSYKTTAISGATGNSYILTSEDVGKSVICVVKNGRGYQTARTPYAGTNNVVAQ